MPCGCKRGSGMNLHGAGYKKRKRRRRKKRGRKGGGLGVAAMFNPVGAALSGVIGLARRRATRRGGGGGRFLSGATWHGYGKGGGMSISGAGLYKKRVVARKGTGRRQI